MSALELKKQEYETALEVLKAKKNAEISAKVEAYRAQLLSEVNNDEEKRLQTVIDALNQVIAFESAH